MSMNASPITAVVAIPTTGNVKIRKAPSAAKTKMSVYKTMADVEKTPNAPT